MTTNLKEGDLPEMKTVPPANDDDLQSKFRLVTLTVHRARQLKDGARPRVDPGNHKFLRVAMLEVMAGMVSWSVT